MAYHYIRVEKESENEEFKIPSKDSKRKKTLFDLTDSSSDEGIIKKLVYSIFLNSLIVTHFI
jgi:hypothetical protein